MLIASAGNDYASDGQFKYYPAGYDSVLAVGSVNKDGSELSDFTQRGKWVNIYACGERIEVATLNGDTRISDGTSFSAAYVTARAAELLQKNKTIDWQKKETARATMRKMVKRLLKKYKYPPEEYEDAIDTVISQCEMWTDNYEQQ